MRRSREEAPVDLPAHVGGAQTEAKRLAYRLLGRAPSLSLHVGVPRKCDSDEREDSGSWTYLHDAYAARKVIQYAGRKVIHRKGVHSTTI